MTDKDKIREEVVGIINSINLFTPDEDGKNSSYEAGKLDAATQILQIIDSFEEPISEDSEKAAIEWYNSVKYKSDLSPINAFKAGVKWKEQQMIKDAIECDVRFDGSDLYTTEAWSDMDKLLHKK